MADQRVIAAERSTSAESGRVGEWAGGQVGTNVPDAPEPLAGARDAAVRSAYRPTRSLADSPRVLATGVVLALAAWAVWSYTGGGILRVLLVAPPGGGSTLDAVRAYVLGYGLFAPIVYVAAVTVEVLVAPIPGALLYAPAGAIFGGLLGGTLSLAGNVLGASIACWLSATFWKDPLARHSQSSQLAHIRRRLQDRGVWVVFLLRLNPLTSSDLVSYAAGLANVPVRHVALGTLMGMLPQCYLQAYLAQTLFESLPSGPWVIIGIGVLIAVTLVVLWRLRK